MRRKFFVIPFFVIALAFFWPSALFSAQAAQPTPVKVQKAQQGTVDTTREYLGTVEAIQRVSVKPELSARITRVHFSEGAYVRAGATLFTLDSSQYQATVALRKAQLARAEAALVQAQRYMKRLKAADKRSVPASDMDTADNDIKQAQASVAEAKATLQLAQIDLNRTKITAPIAGTIGPVAYTKGNYVSSGTELAAIIQMNPIRVAFSMSETDYAHFRDKQCSATLKLSDGSTYSNSASGHHDFTDNTINPSTGTIKMHWSFANPDNSLIPGAMVRISLKPINEETGVFIPQAALMSDINGGFVYIAEGDTAKVRRVNTLTTSGDKVAVSGVKAGELVVAFGTQYLQDGAKIAITEK